MSMKRRPAPIIGTNLFIGASTDGPIPRSSLNVKHPHSCCHHLAGVSCHDNSARTTRRTIIITEKVREKELIFLSASFNLLMSCALFSLRVSAGVSPIVARDPTAVYELTKDRWDEAGQCKDGIFVHQQLG